MNKTHHYSLKLEWTGNKGTGTSDYRSYGRDHVIVNANKPDILCSSDPGFRGDGTKYNPEELFVASVSSCHMLWYLHICAENGVVVVDYKDTPEGIMRETSEGGGHFTEVTLYPKVTVAEEMMIKKANELHSRANELCFIANSCNFKILHKPSCSAAQKT
jgi:organic hydroperoxide reductase OsmC/OhrA